MKRPQLSIRMTLLIMFGVLNILIAILVGKGVYESWTHFRKAKSLNVATVTLNNLHHTNKYLSLSRAASISVVSATPETSALLQKDIAKNRVAADAALELALKKLRLDTDADVIKSVGNVEAKFQTLIKHREQLDASLQQSSAERDPQVPVEFFNASTATIAEVQNLISIYSRTYRTIDPTIYRQMTYKFFVWALVEFTGQEYAKIGSMIASGKHPTTNEQEELLSLRGRIQYGWEIVRRFSLNNDFTPKLLPMMEEAYTHYFLIFDQTRDLFYSVDSVGKTEAYPISVEMWLGMATQVTDSLVGLQNEILEETQNNVEQLENNAKKEIFISIFIFLCAVVVSAYCWWIIVYRVARPVNAMVNALYRATQENIYEMPKMIYLNDEIGKLAQVLEAFQNNARKMKRSNEELERFAFIAAHDLKSPLRAVDNLSQWLEEDLEESLSEKNKKYMDELRKRVRLMDKLLDDTLEYARMDARMDSKNNEIINGKLIMDEIIALLEPAEGVSIKVQEHMADIYVHKFPLQQVLYNLVSNAVKYHDKPQGIIQVDVQENKDDYVFSVSDDGPGIDPQYHQKIFEMFQTLQPRDKSKGRGMGLAVVRKIIITNGGTINVDSELGKGAIFSFTWPKVSTVSTGEYNVDNRR